IQFACPDGQAQGQQDDDGPDPGGMNQADVGVDQATTPGSDCNSDIEGGDVQAGGHIDCFRDKALGLVNNIDLQSGYVAKCHTTPGQYGCQHQPRVVGGKGQRQQDDSQQQENLFQGGDGAALIGQLATPQITDSNRHPVCQQDPAHGVNGKARNLLQHGRQEGEGNERAAVPHRRHCVNQ